MNNPPETKENASSLLIKSEGCGAEFTSDVFIRSLVDIDFPEFVTVYL